MKVEILEKVNVDKNGKTTVVVGEHSHHNHAFMDSDVVDVFRARITTEVEPDGYETLLAVIKDEVEFSHYNVNSQKLTTEHATLVCKPNKKGEVFEIIQQRETNLDDEIVKVVD